MMQTSRLSAADSLDIMNILLGVQEKTGVEVPDDEVENLTSANKILEYVNKA
jgi:acyl carrier protein